MPSTSRGRSARTALASLSVSALALGLLTVAAPAMAQDNGARVPTFSLALERVGGIAYARASDDKSGNDGSSISVTSFGVGGVTPNPFAIPRIGADYIFPSRLTLGGALGFSRISGSTKSGDTSTDVGSVLLYSLTPRVGYRLSLSDRVDLTPRAGVTFAGASASPANSSDAASIFAIALSADAPFAFRLTDSFNLLAGVGLDYTVKAKASVSQTSSSGSSSTSSSTDDVKGSLFSLQAWIGVGGYL